MKKHPPQCSQEILQSYQHHLREVGGLSSKTCDNHSRDIKRFLEAVPIRRATELAKLRAQDLARYLTARSCDYQPGSLRQVAGSLRQFLRFARQQGWTAQPLDLGVPSIACRNHHDLPAHLSQEQLDSLLASWDRSTPQGSRDSAIGLCTARLGLRAGEVAALKLEDLNWRQGTLQIQRSKNGQSARLPLLAEVGESIARYLQMGRPPSPYRQVFLRFKPVRPLSSHAVSYVIQHALRACGILVPRPGAHLLRHTLASHLVQNGATLKEVADLLRHRHLNSAAVYAHVDVAQLRSVAQPWPKEAAL
jgi:site-specific recombinase XerD